MNTSLASHSRTRGWMPGLLALLISACGGGSGGGDDAPLFIDTSQPVALSNSNAVPVSGLVVDAAVGGLAAGTLGTVVVASAETPTTAVSDLSLLRLSRSLLDRVFTLQLQGALSTDSVTAAQVPPSVACSTSGTVAVTWNDADGDGELSVGDSVALSFSSCVEDGLTLNGELEVGVIELLGNPATDPAWNALLRLNFNSLSASDGVSSIAIAGSLDLALDTQASGTVLLAITTEVWVGPGATASSFLHFDEGDDFTELTQYRISLQENPDGSFLLSSQGTLESSFIAGIVTFQTTQDLTGFDFDINDPSAGQVLITGATSSTVLLRVVNSVIVELDVDDEGNGFDAGDITITSSWDELSAAADAL